MYYIDIFFNMHRDIPSHNTKIDPNMYQVDELIMPIINLLNKKGYETAFSCSGHIVDDRIINGDTDEIVLNNNCYIAFKDDIKTLMKKGLCIPEDFEMEELGDADSPLYYRSCIRKTFSIDKDLRYIEILTTMISLYKWVLSLPNARYQARRTFGSTVIEPKNLIF